MSSPREGIGNDSIGNVGAFKRQNRREDRVSRAGNLFDCILLFIVLALGEHSRRSRCGRWRVGKRLGEGAYLSILPLGPAAFRILVKSRPTRVNVLLVCISLSFLLLCFLCVMARPQWSSVSAPWEVSGSDLDIGFWVGTLALAAMSVCGLSWTLHNSLRRQAHAAG